MAAPLERLSAALAGRYRIERELGAGGMATVYLAHDLKHDRQVAIKVLKPELAAVLGAERFVAEIKTTAALQHPHILPLFDSGEADGFLFYVMPFVDGETLRARLDRERQLGVEAAVQITAEVADALQHAHERGVIHRDIKPENILLQNGRPMVADFGIALAVSAAAGGRMTETGLSLGTPHYMSPEQATADREIGARSDVYSLASVLYEMLTGDPPHTGASAQQIIMKIVTEEAAPVASVRRSVPPNVAAATDQALEKLPADRFESAALFRDALRNPGFTAAGRSGARAPAAGSRRLVGLMAAVAVAALALAAWGWLRPVSKAGLLRVPIVLWKARFANIVSSGQRQIGRQAAIAPDGSSIVFADSVGDGVELRRKRRDAGASEPVPGTEGAESPFFSPDGRWIGFVTTDGHIRKQELAGGGAVDVVGDASYVYQYAAWLDDNTIVYVDTASGLSRVDADGGRERVAAPFSAFGEQLISMLSPLPGSRGVLLTLCPGNCLAEPSVAVLDLRTDSVRVLVPGAVGAWYAPTGHLLYTLPTGGLYAVPFDLDGLRVTGGAVSVIEDVSPTEFALSRNGTALYSTGVGGRRNAELVWVGRDGRVTPVDTTWRADFQYPALSPDGQTIAVSVTDPKSTQLWVRRPNGSRQKLTLRGDLSWRPSWSGDGRTIAFVGAVGEGANDWDAFQVPADGGAPAAPLLHQDLGTWEVELSRDGRWLLDRTDNGSGSRSDIHARRLRGDTTRFDVAVGHGFNRQPVLSPDDRWVAYMATESGREEIYVASFPDLKAKRLVSQGGGQEPRWSASGRELFFKSGGAMMVVDVPPGPDLSPSLPRPLFPLVGVLGAMNRQQYDVSPDGQRFLMIQDRSQASKRELIYVENWFDELRARTEAK